MPDNVPFSVHNALTKIFTGGTGHHASSESPKESGEASAPAPSLKPMDPADLRMMLDDGPRAYNDYDERSVFEEIAKLEAVTPPDPALDEWFDEREAEAREAMDNDPNLNH